MDPVTPLLSLSGKRWILHTPEDLSSTQGGTDLIERLRGERGLEAGESERRFDDPTIYPDARKAADRLRHALQQHEQVGIFGDYDCDGITATAQMLLWLTKQGHTPHVRLPHRVHDGYGLKVRHISEMHEQGVTLLLTVDTGIGAHEAVAHAATLGIDVIVLDHHHLREAPPAFAILHPALCPIPPTALPAAAGVVFAFLHALEGEEWEGRDEALVLATLGTIADLVPLRAENRLLVQEGLRAIGRLHDSPLRRLLQPAGKATEIAAGDIAFRIAPRINAAGRMADPMIALEALLHGGEALVRLETLNTARQHATIQCLEEVLSELQPTIDLDTLPPFVASASPRYPHGILGLLAGKVTERFGRPSMIAHIAGDTCVASLRSPAGYNIVEGLTRVAPLLTSFGGHAQAAGCTFPLDCYTALLSALEEDVAAHVPADERIATLSLDAVIDAASLTLPFCQSLRALEPYGQGNPEPLFLLREARLEHIRVVGGEGRHLQATVGPCKLIGFHLGHLAADANQPLDLAVRLGIDHWNGITRPQLYVQDMRAAQEVASLASLA